MALADVVGLEVPGGGVRIGPGGVSSSVRRGGVNLAGAAWTSLWEAVPSVERFTVAVSGQETKFRTGTVPV
jgi:hypothetical protein